MKVLNTKKVFYYRKYNYTIIAKKKFFRHEFF